MGAAADRARLLERGDAEAFAVSAGTVKTHVKRMLAKLDVRDRTQGAVFAFDSGFGTPTSASRT